MLRLTTTKDYTASNDVEVPFSSMSVSDGFMVFTSSSNISLKNNGKGTIIGKHSLYSESDGKTKEYPIQFPNKLEIELDISFICN